MNLLSNYKKLNNSFKKKYIFHIGAQAGFYSEFNNMIYAMLYCLKNKYQFVLYSKDANFKIEKGWEDFFVPFCNQTDNFLLRNINTRTMPPKFTKKLRIQNKILRVLNPNTFLTFELWPKFFNPSFEKEHFNIPELGIDGNLFDASHIIVNMIYNYNEVANLKIKKIKESLKLPKKYLAVNIRRGDKNSEFDYVKTKNFLEVLDNYSHIENVFIFTDDYRVIDEFKILNKKKQYKLHYLISEEEQGYIHAEFEKLDKSQKNEKLYKMFASVDIMSNSEHAFGTYTNNPGFFLGMKMKIGSFTSLQKKIWYQFEMTDVANEMSFEMRDMLKNLNANL